MRHFPHLRHRSRRRFENTREHRLNRIDDHRPRLEPFDLAKNIFEICFRQEKDVVSSNSETFATQLDLAFRFFTGDVKNAGAAFTQFVGDLQQQRTLANARVATDQNKRAANDAATEYAIEFRDP